MGNKTEANKVEIRSLITVSPKLYRVITSSLEKKYRIHSYDLQAGAIKKKGGIHVYLQFGENFNHEKDQFFTAEMLEDDEVLEAFINEVGETCKKVMIDDYFNKMAP